MDDEEFQNFIDSCFAELERKQQHLIDTFSFGEFDRFNLNFDKEEIYLSKSEDVVVAAKIVPIGSFNTDNGTWLWGWANDAFPDSLRAKGAKLKKLEEITGFEIFSDEMSEIDEDMAWEIAGMALHILGFEGIYRGPAKKTDYYYALTEVTNVDP